MCLKRIKWITRNKVWLTLTVSIGSTPVCSMTPAHEPLQKNINKAINQICSWLTGNNMLPETNRFLASFPVHKAVIIFQTLLGPYARTWLRLRHGRSLRLWKRGWLWFRFLRRRCWYCEDAGRLAWKSSLHSTTYWWCHERVWLFLV